MGDATGDGRRTKARRAARRIRRAVRPLARVVAPPAGIAIERDVEVAVRDGTVLRVDVHRPAGGGSHPVLLCAHPYGKSTRPKPRRRHGDARTGRGPRWAVPAQFRLLTQSQPFTITSLTSWEAPDPGFWVPRGYVVVNADLRGWGTSDGTGDLLSAQEGRDIHDLVEWAGTQPWSSGRVGMTGVSYLAIAQWAAAAERPPHLAAINPWEGFVDLYRDFARPGGIGEVGFLRMWATMLRLQRRSPVSMDREAGARPTRDGWWQERRRDIEAIDVPALVCASFSDHCLHSRGSFEGYRRIASAERLLFTHRGPKWAAYYSGPGRAAQVEFFDHHLLGVDTGVHDRAPVRVEIRSDGSTIAAVHHAESWPPARMTWRELALDAAAGTLGAAPERPASVMVDRRTRATFVHRFTEPTDVVGPMWARLVVSLVDGTDAQCHVGLRLVRDGRVVGFEGSYGFGDDLVTHGMLRVAMRATTDDPEAAAPPLPGHPYDRPVEATRLEPVEVDVELHASATRFAAGDELHLVVSGRWFFPTNPLTGQFPARYERPPRSRFLVHTGPAAGSVLHLPAGPPLA